MICALCNKNEANKKNTHYLTDSIIRTCLNYKGDNEREKGYYFDLSNVNPFVEFNFQRETPYEVLKAALGREPNEEEINAAKSVPFSVDNVFCSECENHFTVIENEFINGILPTLRNSNLKGRDQINYKEANVLRLFCYVQVFRTAICEESFVLSIEITESLRNIILEYKSLKVDDYNYLPLSITHLETIGDEKEYTYNAVGFANLKNLKVIFMNDFIIQFFENEDSIVFDELYGVNKPKDFLKFLNVNSDSFLIKIIPDDLRKDIFKDYIQKDKVKQTLQHYKDSFVKSWFMVFNFNPSEQIIQEYINGIVNSDESSALKYSSKQIIDYTLEFILQKLHGRLNN